jgi:cytochrome b involved in lipid metabolism
VVKETSNNNYQTPAGNIIGLKRNTPNAKLWCRTNPFVWLVRNYIHNNPVEEGLVFRAEDI